MHKRASELCMHLENLMQLHIKKIIEDIGGHTADRNVFLENVTETWLNHCQQMHSIRSIFLHLDQTFIIKDQHRVSLWEVGLSMFRKFLIMVPDVEGRVIDGFLQLISSERAGESVNHSVCGTLVRMLVALQLYEHKFQPRFLEESRNFYRNESNRLLDQMLVPAYMVFVESKLQEEKQRIVRYLDSGSRSALIKCCEEELISAHTPVLLSKGFDSIVGDWRVEDASRMYSLFSRVSALPAMKSALVSFVKHTGSTIVQNQAEEKEMVPNLLKLRRNVDSLLSSAMEGNTEFERGVLDAFEFFINSRENRPAELIARFIDMQMRSGTGITESDIEATLKEVVGLFRLLTAKDIFEAFYKKDLAKRLLLGKSASNDLERMMLSKLKAECGSNFTNKLEGMFKDIGISKEHMRAFHESPQYRASQIDMNVFVLTTGFWPAYPVVTSLKIPDQISVSQKAFDDFYLGKFEGRRLTWQHSLGHCLLGAFINGERKELQVSLYQTMVLLLFNTQESIGFTTILKDSGIDDEQLRRTLQSLACGKTRILTKEPRGRDVNNEDVFSINNEFTSKQFRIKINSIQMKETSTEIKETHEKVFADRQYQVDAAIVRIMKSRKTLGHQLLLSELFKQLRFQAKPADLKKRIESLIDREYLERDENDSTLYNYLA